MFCGPHPPDDDHPKNRARGYGEVQHVIVPVAVAVYAEGTWSSSDGSNGVTRRWHSPNRDALKADATSDGLTELFPC